MIKSSTPFSFAHAVPIDVVVGLEQELYETSEDETFVQICAAILDPTTMLRLTSDELMMLQPDFVANLNFSLAEISATGEKIICLYHSSH